MVRCNPMRRRNTINAFHDSWPICPYYYIFNNGSYDDIFLHQHDMQSHQQQRRSALLKRRRVRRQLGSSSSQEHLRLYKRKRTGRVSPHYRQEQERFRKRRFTFPAETFLSSKEQVESSIHNLPDNAKCANSRINSLSVRHHQPKGDWPIGLSTYQYQRLYNASQKHRREKRRTLANVISCLSCSDSIATTVNRDIKARLDATFTHINSINKNINNKQLMSDEELQSKWKQIGQYNPPVDNEKTLEQQSTFHGTGKGGPEKHNINRVPAFGQLLSTYTDNNDLYDNHDNANGNSISLRQTSLDFNKPNETMHVISSPTATETATNTLLESNSRGSYHSSTKNVSDFTAVTSNNGHYEHRNDWRGKARYSQASGKSQKYWPHHRSNSNSSHYQQTFATQSEDISNIIFLLPASASSSNNTSNIHFLTLSSAASISSDGSYPSSLPPRISNRPQRVKSIPNFQHSLTIRPTVIDEKATTPAAVSQSRTRPEHTVVAVAPSLQNLPNLFHFEEKATFSLFQQRKTRIDMLLLLFGFLFFPLWWYGSWRYFTHDRLGEKATVKHVQLINCFLSLVSLLLVGLVVGLVTVWA